MSLSKARRGRSRIFKGFNLKKLRDLYEATRKFTTFIFNLKTNTQFVSNEKIK